MVRNVESLECEIAMRRLMLELGEFKSIARSTDTMRVATILRGEAPWQYSHRTLVAMVAIVEEFVIQRMSSVIDSKSSPSDPIITDALGLSLDRIDQNWAYRVQYAKKWFKLDLAKNDSYLGFQSFVEVRNSIIHGGGRLTRRQTGNDGGRQNALRLKKIGIEIHGDQLMIDASAIQHCFDCSRALVSVFDSNTKRHLSTMGQSLFLKS